MGADIYSMLMFHYPIKRLRGAEMKMQDMFV